MNKERMKKKMKIKPFLFRKKDVKYGEIFDKKYNLYNEFISPYGGTYETTKSLENPILQGLSMIAKMPWASEKGTNGILESYTKDLEYLENYSYNKTISPLVEKLLDENKNLSDENLNKLLKIIYDNYIIKWTKLWDSQNFEYNPIENYDMTENFDENMNSNTDNKTNTTEDKTQNYGKTINNTLEENKTINLSETNNIKNTGT